jgi:hypothetical protein
VGYFHLGFRVVAPERVREGRACLAADGIAVVEVTDEPALVKSFGSTVWPPNAHTSFCVRT